MKLVVKMLYFVLLTLLTTHNFGFAYHEGYVAPMKYFPYQVSIEVPEINYQTCAGALIKLNCVLTAAYCLQDYQKEQLEVRAGTTLTLQGGATAKIQDIVKHPDFNNRTLQNNIALVRLDKEFAQDPTIKPIEMVSADNVLEEKDLVIVSVWQTVLPTRKSPFILRYITMFVLNKEICSLIYEDALVINESNFCGVFDGEIADSNSGGPVMADGKLVGIVSFDQGSTYQGYPGVYMSIANLRSWIDKQM